MLHRAGRFARASAARRILKIEDRESSILIPTTTRGHLRARARELHLACAQTRARGFPARARDALLSEDMERRPDRAICSSRSQPA
jgi:hypothetical protein